MQPFSVRAALAAALALSLSGCASLSPERGYAESATLVQQRIDQAPSRTAPTEPALSVAEPLDREHALRIALAYNPRTRAALAEIGLGRAELDAARRLANPGFSFSRLREYGGGTQITRSLSLSLSDALLLPARRRFAEAELERVQFAVADQVLSLAAEVDQAWYRHVSAQQVAALRDLVAIAAERSATLAQRFFDAGNIHRLQLEQEYAAASAARIEAAEAQAEALHTRLELADVLGLPLQAAWRIDERLPAPPTDLPGIDQIVPLALQSRLDLQARRGRVAQLEDALGVTRRWRWLGEVEFEYERESEGGGVKRGPSLSLQLPLFNQGQAAVMRAEAELEIARAELDGALRGIENRSRHLLAALALQQQIVERYRDALLPRRDAVVERMQERVNYMLTGVFELIAAKQSAYDGYQAYLESVRDYWLTRAELRAAVGGHLPGDEQPTPPSLGVDAVLPKPAAESSGHEGHHGHHGGGAPAAAADPHAHHRAPAAAAPAEHSAHRHGEQGDLGNQSEHVNHSNHGSHGSHGSHGQPATQGEHSGHGEDGQPDRSEQPSDPSAHQHHGDRP